MSDFMEFMDFAKQHLPINNAQAEVFKEQVRKEYGGESIYVAKSDDKRDKLIRQLYNGRNAQELMRQFGIGRSNLYRIVSTK